MVFNQSEPVPTLAAVMERAVQAANDSPDDDQVIDDLTAARNELMEVLKIALAWENGEAPVEVQP